jgi:predicted lipoprotein with Yx(FWY)xxD motif
MRTTKLLAVLAAAGLVLAACGDDDDSSGATDDATTTTANDGAEVEATVAVATDDALGDYLVGPDGRTLYLFEEDQGTTTACTGACADNWPPLVADGAPTGGDGVAADELSTADGIEPNQVTYHGHLLYYFASDEAPGDTNGVGIPSWYPVDPAGEAIGEDEDE